MPISLLRRPSRPREPSVAPAIGHLSLPDLTAPLIDPAAFASMPRRAGPGPGASNGVDYSYQYQHEYDPNPPQSSYSHSPPSPHTSGRAPSLVRDMHGHAVTHFHRPFSPANAGAPMPAAARRGKAKARRMAMLTVMVVGPAGGGKTSFIDALAAVLDPDSPRPARRGTTTSVLRHEISTAGGRRFVVLDTPGLPLPYTGKRHRALNALTGIVEARLAHQLSEENKVVRRKSDGAELVHLIIYTLDARTALTTHQALDIDWDTVAEPKLPAEGALPRPESHLEPDAGEVDARLPIEDIEAIRRFSIRGNVLPVLTHADALTTNELEAVRTAVVRDLATVFGRDPLGAWGILSSGSDPDEDPTETPVPYAIFAPEPGPGFTRAFRWGRADAGDAAHSDLPAVMDVLMSAADWLRTSTREVVYEKFRTEMLLSARGVRAQIYEGGGVEYSDAV